MGIHGVLARCRVLLAFVIISLYFISISCSKKENRSLNLQYDSSIVASSSAKSALLAVVRQSSSGTVEILQHSGFQPPDKISLNVEVPDAPDAEVVLLTFGYDLNDASPTFSEPGKAGAGLSQAAPLGIFHSPMSGSGNLKILESSDSGAKLVSEFSQMIYVDQKFILPDIVPTPTPPETVAPTAPATLFTFLARDSMNAPTGRINLVWTNSTDNVGVTDYYIYRRDISSGEWVYSSNYRGTESTQPPFSDPSARYQDNPSPDYEHYFCYVVRAVDAAGNVSAPSNESCLVASADPSGVKPASDCAGVGGQPKISDCIVTEAEGGMFTGGLTVVSDSSGSPSPMSVGASSFGGLSVWAGTISNFVDFNPSPGASATNFVEYPVPIENAVDQYLWIRFWAPDTSNDAIVIRVLDSSRQTLLDWNRIYPYWGSDTPPLDTFQWRACNGSAQTCGASNVAMKFHPSAVGLIYIQLANAEQNARMDRILITPRSGFTPTQIP